MKKIKYIMMIAGFAAMGCGQPTDNTAILTANTCEELKSYIYMDRDNDVIPNEYAEYYIELLNEIIELNGFESYRGCQNCDEID
jgi:hypothetical protein